MDNGILSCANPTRLQQILDELDGTKIEALAHKWLDRLPDPFTDEDHEVGYNYRISIPQAEFSRTRVFGRPLSGRHLFEELIRKNIDLGHPSKVNSIFGRRINKRALHQIEWVTSATKGSRV
uniref:Uncharacterized protein n=1 Tax=Candidatus Kentrum sp. TC TaxID=2126339 RepID=A0A450YR03_9GAMM|nr:MAG: hypothetical protein BECKTC1821E_GA0114239_10302 [Candidatus Kentron sp. TC]